MRPRPLLSRPRGFQVTGRPSYLRRPCGPRLADSPHGTHSGQDPGGPGTCACSLHSGLHTGFSLQAWDRREEIRVGGGGPWQIQGTWPRASHEAPPGALNPPSISNLTGGAVGLPPPRCGSPGDTPENRAGCQPIPPQTLLGGARCPVATPALGPCATMYPLLAWPLRPTILSLGLGPTRPAWGWRAYLSTCSTPPLIFMSQGDP